MISIRRERDEDVTVVSNPYRTLRDARRIAATSSAAILVENTPIPPHSLEEVLEGVATPVPRAEGEDRSDGVANGPVSEERPAPKTRSPHSASTARLENTMCEQVAKNPALVEDLVIRLFRDAGLAMESSPDMNIISVIQTVGSRAPAKVFGVPPFTPQ